MVDKKACVSQQWGGNTINSGLYLKKERLALSFKYSVSISQPFKPSNKSFKYCTIISNVQWLPSLTIKFCTANTEEKPTIYDLL